MLIYNKYIITEDVRNIDCVNIFADKSFITSFYTEKVLSKSEISKLQSYAQEIYGSGIIVEEFCIAFVRAMMLLLHIEFQPYYNNRIPKTGKNTYDIRIFKQNTD